MYFICKYILPACMFVYHMNAQESQETTTDPLELELGTVVRGYVGAGTQLKSSARAASVLTIVRSPQPHSSHLTWLQYTCKDHEINMEGGESRIKGHPWLHCKFKASLSYINPISIKWKHLYVNASFHLHCIFSHQGSGYNLEHHVAGDPTQGPLSPKQVFYHYTNKGKKSLHLCLYEVLFMFRLRFCVWEGVGMENTQQWPALLIPSDQEGLSINLWHSYQAIYRVCMLHLSTWHYYFPLFILCFQKCPINLTPIGDRGLAWNSWVRKIWHPSHHFHLYLLVWMHVYFYCTWFYSSILSFIFLLFSSFICGSSSCLLAFDRPITVGINFLQPISINDQPLLLPTTSQR